MKGRIGTSVSLDAKAMKAHYQLLAQARQAHANRREMPRALGRGPRRIVVIPPKAATQPSL